MKQLLRLFGSLSIPLALCCCASAPELRVLGALPPTGEYAVLRPYRLSIDEPNTSILARTPHRFFNFVAIDGLSLNISSHKAGGWKLAPGLHELEVYCEGQFRTAHGTLSILAEANHEYVVDLRDSLTGFLGAYPPIVFDIVDRTAKRIAIRATYSQLRGEAVLERDLPLESPAKK